MKHQFRHEKWTSCAVLYSQLDEIKSLCHIPENGFANPTQFINFVLRKELERRMKK